MSDVTGDLRTAFEDAGYGVDAVSDNRGQVRVTLLSDDADVDELRSIVEDACGAEAVVGFDAAPETSADDDAVGTIVSFRYRP